MSRFAVLLMICMVTAVHAEESKNIDALQKKFDVQQERLKANDLQSAQLRVEIKELQEQRRELRKKHRHSLEKQRMLAADLMQHKNQLAKQLRFIHRQSFHEQIPSLASSERYAAEINSRRRYRHYFESISGLQIANIQAIELISSQYQSISLEARQESENLAAHQRALSERQKTLSKERKAAIALVKQLERAIAQNQKIAAYSRSKARKSVRRASKQAYQQRTPLTHQSLQSRKRLINWPAMGIPTKITYFDNAWLVQQNKPTEVRAIASGIVTAIQWIPNLGLTIAVNHGNGFIAFYARVDASYVKEGESISENQTIAVSGHNVELAQNNGLIFMLIKKGRQLNLAQWLRPIGQS